MWQVLHKGHGEDIDSLTNTITNYINFCVENTHRDNPPRLYSVSLTKPWINPEIKAPTQEEKEGF